MVGIAEPGKHVTGFATDIERELQQQLFQSDDAREGLNAYVEKRQAEFTGS